jgi:hypothetical protein
MATEVTGSEGVANIFPGNHLKEPDKFTDVVMYASNRIE